MKITVELEKKGREQTKRSKTSVKNEYADKNEEKIQNKYVT